MDDLDHIHPEFRRDIERLEEARAEAQDIMEMYCDPEVDTKHLRKDIRSWLQKFGKDIDDEQIP